ncbi:MAG: hypothetical protein AB8B53_14630 [Flavobacteriales bacterium]
MKYRSRISIVFISILTLSFLGLYSCGNSTLNNDPYHIRTRDDFEMISLKIKDSLLFFMNSGRASAFLTKVSAIENEENSTLEWILTHGSSQDFESLLHHFYDPELIAVGVKGLIRNQDEDLFKHLTFSINQDINVQYGMFCQKSGGYFLYQLDYSKSDSESRYFSKTQLGQIKKMITARMFGCT